MLELMKTIPKIELKNINTRKIGIGKTQAQIEARACDGLGPLGIA